MQRLHIVIDETLDPIYGCVQGGHSVAQWILDNPDQQWNNDYLIYLKGNLMNIINKLEMYDVDYTQFKEPDLDNKITSIAVLGNEKMFKKLKLMGK